MGQANKRMRKALERSFAISMPRNRDRKESPNTAIPGVKAAMPNISAGISGTLRFIIEISRINTTGNPMPNRALRGSRTISRAFRAANAIVLMPAPPRLSGLKTHPPAWRRRFPV